MNYNFLTRLTALLIDKLKDKDRSTLANDDDISIDNIKNNREKTGENNCIRAEKNETIRDTELNNQNDKQKGVAENSSNNRSPSKKLKRRFKTTNQIKINSNENISARCGDSVYRSKSSFNAVIPELLPCNIVNLNLDGLLIENKNETIDEKMNETNDNETSRPCSRIVEKPRKNVRKKRNTESKTKQENDDNSVESSNGKAKLVTEKDSFVETDYSSPVYEKFLSFNSSSPKRDASRTLIFEKDVKNKVECFDRKSDLEEGNKYLDDSLPLTGDPEIDEEIIAFYKAKRSGGIY